VVAGKHRGTTFENYRHRASTSNSVTNTLVIPLPYSWRKEVKDMKTKLIAGFLLAGSCLFAAPRIAVGVGIGVGVPVGGYYAPAPAYVAPAPAYVAPAYVPPPAPAPGYAWVGGYWVGVGPGRVWHPGYWAAPRYFGPRARFRR
jgi:hypothetical protein